MEQQKIIKQGAAGNSLHMLNTKLTKKGNRNVDQLSTLDHLVPITKPWSSRKLTARENRDPNPNKKETEMLINCQMWTTSRQT